MRRNMIVLNGAVFLDGKFKKRNLKIENGIFTEIAKPETPDVAAFGASKEFDILDATDKYIIPGLVDVHTHGRTGLDFSKISEEELEKILVSYGDCGVTNVVATTMTNDPAALEESLCVLGGYIQKQKSGAKKGARLLGIHMEGPFLGKEKKGAHDERYLQNPEWNRFEQGQKKSGGNIRLITIDPCLDEAEEFIKKCGASGVKVSLGHTACGYDTAVKAVQAGADHVTHTFNAMNSLHHREPGIIGAAMDSGMYMELVCDGIHVHPALVRLLFAAHPDKVVLVSDSIPAAGMPDGEYTSGGFKVVLNKGKAVLEDGTIAGSAISLFDAVRNAIHYGVPAEQAVNSATYLPAKSVGMESVAGTIAVGHRAEFLVADREWNLERIYV